jgi:hypothetical protein
MLSLSLYVYIYIYMSTVEGHTLSVCKEEEEEACTVEGKITNEVEDAFSDPLLDLRLSVCVCMCMCVCLIPS